MKITKNLVRIWVGIHIKKELRDFDKIVALVAESKFSSVKFMQGLIQKYELLELTTKMPQTNEECKEIQNFARASKIYH